MKRSSSRPLAIPRAILVALSALVSLIGACGGDVVGGTSTPCKEASDCSASPGLNACVSGTCKAPEGPVSCKTDGGCELFASAVCEAGVCARACASDPECAAGTICVSGACAARPSEGECSSNQDCAAKGELMICRGHQCVSLTSPLCQTIATTTGDAAEAYLDDDAVFVGSIFPGSSFDGAFGEALRLAATLAIEEIGAAGGLPPAHAGGARRPMVMVGCTDGPNEDQASEAAEHLTKDLGIQAILGHAFSGATIAMATNVTIPAGALLFSPSATNDALAAVQDHDLLWSAAAPDGAQGLPLARYYPEVEARARARYPLIGDAVRVAVVRSTDSYAVDLGEQVEKALVFNGQSATSQLGTRFAVFAYGSAEAPNVDAIAKVADFAPHVIFLFGFQESVSPILSTVEQTWVVPAEGHRPFWILGDAGRVSTLWEQVITSADLRTRVTGSEASAHAIGSASYTGFAVRWNGASSGSAIPPSTTGLTGAYDITYLFALSAAAVGAGAPTGENLVQLGLRRMQPSPGLPVVSLGPATFASAAAQLAAGASIDVEGASGSLDFDPSGTTFTDTVIWCLPQGTGGKAAGPAIDSGRYHQRTTNQMMGVFSAACGLP